MFVNIMQFPFLEEAKEAEFRQWFKWSNEQYAKHPGYIRRRLLKPRKGGNFVAIIEHENFETFKAMHSSQTQAIVHEHLKSILDGGPTAQFYDQVEG